MDVTGVVLSSDLRILLHELQERPPALPHELVELLAAIRTAAASGPPLTPLPGTVAAVERLWAEGWRGLQRVDIFDAGPGMCPTLPFLVFGVLSTLAAGGYIARVEPVPALELTSAYASELLGESGSARPATMAELRQTLYNVHAGWYRHTYGHHELLGRLLPVFRQCLYDLLGQPGTDLEDVKWCEVHLRTMWQPLAVRSYFTLAHLPAEPGDYAVIYSRVHERVAELMSDPNAIVLSHFRRQIIDGWVLPAVRNVVAQLKGIPPHAVSDGLIAEYTPVQHLFALRDWVSGDDVQQRVYAGPPSQVRQLLVLMQLTETFRLLDGVELSESVKPLSHLWHPAALAEIARSRTPYLIQAAGTYCAVANGELYISESIEEAFAQYVYLLPPGDRMRRRLSMGAATLEPPARPRLEIAVSAYARLLSLE